jgi:tetratricopeptide (TPR) repeat protein
MKKILIVLVLVAASQISNAQKQKVNSAWNYLKYEEYDKAKAAIDEAEANEDSKGLWKTWYYKGLIYQAIYEKKLDKQMNAGDALKAACEAYKKSLDIDAKHDYADEALKNLQAVNYLFGKETDLFYKEKDFSKSLEAIKMQLSIYDYLKKFYPTLTNDTGSIYNAGIIADKANNTTEAIGFYEKLVGLKYKEAYSLLASDYCKLKDTTKAIKALEDGSMIYPTEASIIYGFVNIYANTHQYDKAIGKINDAIKVTPDNVMLYVILGNAYEHMDKDADAEVAYNTALSKDANNYDAIKSIGINIYNQAAKINKEMNDLPTDAPQSKYDNLAKKRNEILNKALPYLEKANGINATDEEVLRPLKKSKSLLGK